MEATIYACEVKWVYPMREFPPLEGAHVCDDQEGLTQIDRLLQFRNGEW